MELRAGKLCLFYEAGALRRICIGRVEVIRMVSLAVRDTDWGTLAPVISGLRVDDGGDGFSLSYHCRYEQGSIRWEGRVRAEGRSDNSIFFDIHLSGGGSFRHNRSGLFLLHPVEGLAGRDCRIIHPDGGIESLSFPDHISPWQPFKAIRAMEWEPADGISARVDLSGEVFETEDHRNWSDHSFKTYGPPLDRPFPELEQHSGDEIHQSLLLRVSGGSVMEALGVSYVSFRDSFLPVPPIGISLQDDMMSIGELRAAGLSFISLSLLLAGDWRSRLLAALEESRHLHFPLELRLVLPQEWSRSFDELVDMLSPYPLLGCLCFYQQDRAVPEKDLLEEVCLRMREVFPNIPIGTGTTMHFAELNRWVVDDLPIDYVSYPLHPQVHAFDDRTLVENLPAQFEMIQTARCRFPGKGVFVGPVSLKGAVYDDRYAAPFGAAWVLGSLKYLLEGGADSITYATPYPLFVKVFKMVLKERPSFVRRTVCSHPYKVSSLLIGDGERGTLLLANHTASVQAVHLFDGRELSLEPYEIISMTSTQSHPGPSVGG